MGVVGELWAILAAIYLLECIAWVPDGAHAFGARPTGPWGRPPELWSVFDGRWRACGATVVPGTGGIVFAEARPPLVSPQGICTCRTDTANRGAPVPFESLGGVHADEHVVRVERRVITRAATRTHAAQLASWLSDLSRLPSHARAERIEEHFRLMLDTRAARRALRRYRWCAGALAWPVRFLALGLFVALPLAITKAGPVGAGASIVLVLGLVALVVWEYVSRMRRLGFKGLFSHAAMMVLAPPVAVRADDIAGREFFVGLHTLAVARAACPPGDARELASTTLRALLFPLPGEDDSCCEASAWSLRAWRAALDRWIESEYGSAAALLTPPQPESSRMRAYCPRCHQQYERTQGECSDCTGISLTAFGTAHRGARFR